MYVFVHISEHIWVTFFYSSKHGEHKGRHETRGELLWGGLIAFIYLSVSKRDRRAGEGFIVRVFIQ